MGEECGGLNHPVDHGLAAFAAQQVGDFRHPVGQDAAEPQQADAAAGKAEAGPPGGRRPGPVDRGRDVIGPGDRNPGDRFAGRGLVETSSPSWTMGRPEACVAVMTRLPDLGDRVRV